MQTAGRLRRGAREDAAERHDAARANRAVAVRVRTRVGAAERRCCASPSVQSKSCANRRASTRRSGPSTRRPTDPPLETALPGDRRGVVERLHAERLPRRHARIELPERLGVLVREPRRRKQVGRDDLVEPGRDRVRAAAEPAPGGELLEQIRLVRVPGRRLLRVRDEVAEEHALVLRQLVVERASHTAGPSCRSASGTDSGRSRPGRSPDPPPAPSP